MSNQTKPFYLVPANKPFLRSFDALFTRLAEPEMHTLIMEVHTKLVDAGDVAGLQQVIMALQHQPHLIEKMIFALDLQLLLSGKSILFIKKEAV